MESRMAGLAEQFMSSWTSEIFRQRCTAQIEAVRCQTKPRRQQEDPVENFLAENTSAQLEEFIFNKSKSREDYMSLVSDMIMMLKQHAGKDVVDMSVLANASEETLEAAGVSKEGIEKINQANQNGDSAEKQNSKSSAENGDESGTSKEEK